MRRTLLLAALVMVLVACGSDGGEVGTGGSTTSTAPAPDRVGDRLELCRDVPPITTEVIGTLGGMANVDDIFAGVIATYTQEHADTFAGRWIDRDAGGTVIVAFTDDPEPHLEALRLRRPLPTDDVGVVPRPTIVDDRPIGEWDQAFDVVQVAYSQRDLDDAQGAVLAALGRAGVQSTGYGTNVTRNRIGVDVEVVTEEQLVAAAQQLDGVAPLDMVCIDGELDTEQPPPIDPDTPLEVIVLPSADGTYPADTIVACDGARFRFGALDPLVPIEDAGLPELAAALDAALSSGEGEFLGQGGWSVLDAGDETATLVRIDGATLSSIGFEKVRTGWRVGGSSAGEPCDVVLPLPNGYGEVEWSIDPAFEAPTATSTEIHVLVTGTACSSGQALGDRLLGPQVVTTDDAVRIAFAAILLTGAQNCQGNPAEPITVTLDGPLGERQILDGRIIGRIDKLVARG
jgi:hypothetical protein